MVRYCKICGTEIQGRAKFCRKCQQAKERDYQRKRYNTDEDFRRKKIESAKKQQQNRNRLGQLHRYSEHAQSDFDKEHQVVQNMKKQSLKGKPNARNNQQNNGDNYNVEAYERYNSAVAFEEQKLDNFKTCPICSGHVFERMNGMIVCMTCGVCEEVFCNTVFGFDEWTAEDLESDFIRDLRRLGDE